MMMIREAQGDPAAALAENDQATLARRAARGIPQGRARSPSRRIAGTAPTSRRMLAESRAGAVKQALVQYAQAALDEYRAQWVPRLGGRPRGVLRRARRRRDVALAPPTASIPRKDDDIEDLYLVVVGLEAGGDHAAAEAVRRVMRRPGGVHIARAIMLRWLDLDAKRAARARRSRRGTPRTCRRDYAPSRRGHA